MEAPGTLDTLLRGLRARLQHAGIEAPGLEARMLVGAATGLDTAALIRHGDAPPSHDQAAAVEALCQRRLAGEPIAHILGRRAFWTLELGISAACLVPRPETEWLVEQALAAIDQCPDPEPCVLDLGTGPGPIILALRAERPHIRAFACDRSASALRQARTNATELGLPVALWQGHWLHPVKAGIRFDIITCNPPYIAPEDPHLTRGDLRFEPRAALVAGDAGLGDLFQVIDTARAHLEPGASLILEHGYEQGPAVRKRLLAAGYSGVRTQRDDAGHERISSGRNPARRGRPTGSETGIPRPE